MTRLILIYSLLVSIFCFKAQAQVSAKDPLFIDILKQDSLLFSVGFNTCNVQQMEQILSDNFVFYHDKDGPSNKENFIKNFKNGLCKNIALYQSKRELIPNTAQIFPLYENGKLYAALQNGDHWFYEKEQGQIEKKVGYAKFSHLWVLENKIWKLKSSFSFDHQPVVEEKTTLNNLEDIDRTNNWLKENKIKNLGVAIIESGSIKSAQVYGEVAPGKAAPNHMIFNVASLTKPITALLALRLATLGKWNIDAPLSKFWIDPDVANDSRNALLTTRLVLSHQTGFPNWRWQNPSKKLAFDFSPGTRYQYSGEGFEYLRKAIEHKFKKSLNELATEYLFKPLKLSDTEYIWTKKTDSSRFAIGYDEQLKTYPLTKNVEANAADDLHTTLQDYSNFLIEILNGTLLSDSLFKEMTKKQVQSKANKYFGLGFEMYDLGNNEMALAHGGSDVGSRCIFFILPKSKKGLLIMSNSDNGYLSYEPLLKYYLGEVGEKIIAIEMNKKAS